MQKILTLISLAVIVPIGFFSKFYHGPAAFWVNNSLSGVFYEIFWCLIGLIIFPKSRPLNIVIWVLSLTCFLEFLQLWHPPFLQILRNSFIGRTLLGTSFAWSDFPYYFIGCGLGWLWLHRLQKLPAGQSGKKRHGDF